jgi:integrase
VRFAPQAGRRHILSLSSRARHCLEAARAGIGDAPLFPAGGLTIHSARARWRHWWLQAERLAGLKHEARFGWHSLRHAFATALRSQPDVDVAALGGWKSPVTLKLCYQHPELDRMRQALRQLRTESTNGEQAAELAM